MFYSDFYGVSVSNLAKITDLVTDNNEAYWEATGTLGKAYQQIKTLFDELGNDPAGASSDVTTRLDPSNYISEILTVDGVGSGLDADFLHGTSGSLYARKHVDDRDWETVRISDI